MKYGLFFDCDGVLADTRRANYFSYLAALEIVLGTSLGGRFSYQFFISLYGKAWLEWLPELAGNAAEEVHQLKIQIYASYLRRYAEPLAGLHAIKYWGDRGVPIAIVSNASARSIAQLIEWLEDEFDAGYLRDIPIITPTKMLAAKPHPSLLQEACVRLGVTSGILIDDDFPIGTMTAQSSNIPFIHYTGELSELNAQIERLLA